MFRWFVGLGVDDPVWDPSTFSKNRDRLLEGEIAAKFLATVLAQPKVKRLLSSDHFSVDGTLIEAWASIKSFRRKDGDDDDRQGPGRNAADRKARAIVEGLRAGRMNTAADLVERSVHETLTYYAFPDIHWHKIRTNNPLERIMREIRRRTRVVGAFPDGQSCLNLAAARLRYIAGTAWSAKCYMNMRPLYQPQLVQTEAVA